MSSAGEIEPKSEDFSAFVFKIQANMNKAHRDRIAFIRTCSAQFERGMDVFHVQGNKKIKLAQSTQLMADGRETVDEAYAGDIIGIFDPGIFSIGDTLTTAKVPYEFAGIPTFALRAFCTHFTGGHHETQAICKRYGANCAGGCHSDFQRAGRRYG